MAFRASESASAMRQAMKGLGTDDRTLICQVAEWSSQELQEVRRCYESDFQRDLIDDVRSETSGAFESALVGLLYQPAEFEASLLHSACKGLGTNEDAFVHILCHRDTSEIEAIESAYQRMFGKTLKQAVSGDFTGDGRKLAMGLLSYDRKPYQDINNTEIEMWMLSLHSAGEGRAGTDEDTFVEVICGSAPNWLLAINEAYNKRYGHPLADAVRKEFNGFAAKALQAMLVEHDEYYADLIHSACSGITDTDVLTRVMVARRHRLRGINDKFVEKYKCSISEKLQMNVSGKLGELLKKVAMSANC